MLRLKYNANEKLLEEIGFELDSCDNYGLYLKDNVLNTFNAGEVLYIELDSGRIVHVTDESAAGKSLDILFKLIKNNLVEEI